MSFLSSYQATQVNDIIGLALIQFNSSFVHLDNSKPSRNIIYSIRTLGNKRVVYLI